MFKRRKSDEAPAAAKPAPVAVTEPSAGSPGDGAPITRSQDTGLGVPPFRPVTVPTPAVGPTPLSSKEAPSMGRVPFSSTPAPSSANPSPVSVPPPPMRPSGSMPSPAITAPPAAPAPAPINRPVPVRDPAERRTLVVGRGISVQGTVQDAERLVVEGTVEASMIHATELSISHGGVFKGEVEVDDAEVAGTIDGTLTAKNSLVVRASGRLLGTARCKRLQVEDGGQITGRIEMIVDGKVESKPAADAA